MKKTVTTALALVLGVSVMFGALGCKKEEAPKTPATPTTPTTSAPAK